jgi:hypothetical protein
MPPIAYSDSDNTIVLDKTDTRFSLGTLHLQSSPRTAPVFFRFRFADAQTILDNTRAFPGFNVVSIYDFQARTGI